MHSAVSGGETWRAGHEVLYTKDTGADGVAAVVSGLGDAPPPPEVRQVSPANLPPAGGYQLALRELITDSATFAGASA